MYRSCTKILLHGVATVSLLGALHADDPSKSAAFEAATKQQKITPADLLREFEPEAETEYHLGEGDEIDLGVWGRPELSGKQVVGPDGRITVPYAGPVKLAGLTRTAAAALVAERLKPAYDDVSATITVVRYESNRVYVLGRVASPGILRFDYQPTLLEAVTRAGALPVGGIGADKASLTKCMIFRGRDKLAWIDLKSLLNGSNLSLNLRLQRNDVLYIPDSDDQTVYVLGEVQRPGAVHLSPDMTFLDALSQAGGPTRDASTGKIRLVRPSAGIERDMPLANFVKGGASPNVALRDGDVIYVPRTGVAKVGYLLQQLSPAVGWMTFGAALGTR